MIITGIEKDPKALEFKARLLGSLLFFIQTFFKFKTGRDFYVGHPAARESHYITICRELMNVFYLQTNRLLIQIPPGHGKSTMLTYFAAWCFAHYPDCQFMYISYSHDLAAKHTANIKEIMSLQQYRKIFGVEISKDSSAKDDFQTNFGGAVKAFGSSGGITGQDAGLQNLDRFSGCPIMDDMHKPDEVHSDPMRQGVITNYNQTIKPRPRAPNVPMIGLGQALHEADLFQFLKGGGIGEIGGDGKYWKQVILKSIDDAGNILAPHLTPKEMLDTEKKYNPYVFHAQYQQDPQPAGGAIFKEEYFALLPEDPKMLLTFLTVDTAETNKDYNDASVFSFWGLYHINDFNRSTNQYGLHWISCRQIRVEPAELEPEFIQFHHECMGFETKPSFVAIEKKSTGATLISILKKARGLDIKEIERTKASGSKTARYLEIQPYVARRLVSLREYGMHTKMCIDHCKKITANNTHAHDDIADTLYDALKIGVIEQHLITHYFQDNSIDIFKAMSHHNNSIHQMRAQQWQKTM